MCIGNCKGVPTYFSSSQFYADSKYAYVHVSILWSRWNIVQKLKLSTRYGLLQFLALTPTFAVGPMWRTLVSFRCKYLNISWTSGYLEDTSWTFLLPGGKVVAHWEQKREALALLPCRQPGKNHIFSFSITWSLPGTRYIYLLIFCHTDFVVHFVPISFLTHPINLQEYVFRWRPTLATWWRGSEPWPSWWTTDLRNTLTLSRRCRRVWR